MKMALALAGASAITLANLVFLVPRLWRGDERTVHKLRQGFKLYWIFGDWLLEGLIRALPILNVGLSFVCLGVGFGWAVNLKPLQSLRWNGMTTSHRVTALLMVLAGICMILSISIAVVRRPRCLIPPPLRDERGSKQPR